MSYNRSLNSDGMVWLMQYVENGKVSSSVFCYAICYRSTLKCGQQRIRDLIPKNWNWNAWKGKTFLWGCVGQVFEAFLL